MSSSVNPGHKAGPPIPEFNFKNIPLLMMAGLWEAHNVVLEGGKILNERRDYGLDLMEKHQHTPELFARVVVEGKPGAFHHDYRC
jgi:hypothetical protein